MKSALVPGAFALAALAAACGGDDGGGGGIKVPDAGNNKQPDAPPAPVCAAQADYATPTPMSPAALRICAMGNKAVKCPTTATTGIMGIATDPILVAYFFKLNADNDFFEFDMWKGAVPFMTKIQPASNISFADATQSQWSSCGACAFVSAKVDSTGADMGTYLANAGTGNVTTVTLVDKAANTKLTVTVTVLVLVLVDIDSTSGMSTASADGCSTKIASVNFDLAIGDPAAMLVRDPVTEFEWARAQRALDRHAH
jgi:hypothetical protein